jgi:hypothetical protein
VSLLRSWPFVAVGAAEAGRRPKGFRAMTRHRPHVDARLPSHRGANWYSLVNVEVLVTSPKCVEPGSPRSRTTLVS